MRFGKRPALTADQVTELREKREQGVLIRERMADYGLSKATIYRYLARKDAEVNFCNRALARPVPIDWQIHRWGRPLTWKKETLFMPTAIPEAFFNACAKAIL